MKNLTSTRAIAHRCHRMYAAVDRAADRLDIKPEQVVDGERLYLTDNADKIVRELSVADRRKTTDIETAALR